MKKRWNEKTPALRCYAASRTTPRTRGVVPRSPIPSQHGKPNKQAAEHNSQPVRLTQRQDRRAVPLVAAITIIVVGAAGGVGVDHVRGVVGLAGGRPRGRGGRLDLLGAEGAAGVVLAAGAGALAIVVRAVVDALGAPFAADEVGDGQGVLGYVGLLVVAAEAAVSERILAAPAWLDTAQHFQQELAGLGLTTSQSFTSVVPGLVCSQIRGQLATWLLHHCSATLVRSPIPNGCVNHGRWSDSPLSAIGTLSGSILY